MNSLNEPVQNQKSSAWTFGAASTAVLALGVFGAKMYKDAKDKDHIYVEIE